MSHHHEHEHQHGHACACHEHDHGHEHHHDHEGGANGQLVRIGICMTSLGLLHFLPESWAPLDGWLRLTLYLAVYLTIGWTVLREALEGIAHGEVFDENFLMMVATAGAFGLALYEGSGDYNEAIAVMLFFQIGEFFEGYAVAKSRRNITALMDIRPDYAHVEQDGQLRQVAPETVAVGSVIVVQPGEKVPIDGVVEEGVSMLNTVALTGEALPREARKGVEALSGSINLTGVLHIRTTKSFGESTVSKILDLVQHSNQKKAKSEQFITRVSRVYTPIVCACALALALLPPLVLLAVGQEPAWSTWVYRALIFLVISCPCALVISIPLTFFAGIGGAGRAGILLKGSTVVEKLSRLRTVVLDKTGTLTRGVFEVVAVHDIACNENERRMRVLEAAAFAECSSSHPIASSLRGAYGRELDRSRVTEIQEHAGEGVVVKLDGVPVAVGNAKLMETLGIACSAHCSHTGTVVHVAIDGRYAGHIVLGDVVKESSCEAIAALHRMGVERTVMLTGDSQEVADRVAAELNLDEVHGGLLPAGKVEHLERLMASGGEHAMVAFVGDGINDAPVLMRADVGIAMGGAGSDAAIEAAEVVLMDDDPLRVAQAVRIARRTIAIVWQNIVFAISIKVLCLLLGALGFANMWMAVFADVGVMVLAVLNALRALRK